MFLTTARGSRACTVFLSQNISNYYVTFGSTQGKDMTNSLLGNLNTKIFHANTGETNTFAADLIGRTWQTRTNVGTQVSQEGGHSRSIQTHDSLAYEVEPREFMTLKTGGNENNKEVEGYIIQGGTVWKENQKVYLKARFKQEY